MIKHQTVTLFNNKVIFPAGISPETEGFNSRNSRKPQQHPRDPAVADVWVSLHSYSMGGQLGASNPLRPRSHPLHHEQGTKPLGNCTLTALLVSTCDHPMPTTRGHIPQSTTVSWPREQGHLNSHSSSGPPTPSTSTAYSEH